MKKLRYADLFSGVGGLSLGFLRAGFEHTISIDANELAVECYRKNIHKGAICDTITEKTELPDVDLIIGGPPCQGFSSAGLRKNGDHRNSLVSVYANLIAKHRPKAFLFENVEGFLTAENGNRVIDLLEPLLAAGYRMHFRKINAANYGVPQLRKRVICIGGLGWTPTFPEPTHSAFGAPGVELIGNNLPKTPTLRDALKGLPTPEKDPPGNPFDHFIRPISESDQKRIALLRPGQLMRDLPQELWHDSYKRRANRRVMDGTPSEKRGGAPAGLRRLIFDEPCKAITSGATSEFVHPLEDRFLTLRECARIQTFPDDFNFTGNQSDRALQIGNAVPPMLSQQIATFLFNDMCNSVPEIIEPALLSFIPTNSNGMSPALMNLTNRVLDKFGAYYSQPRQLSIWASLRKGKNGSRHNLCCVEKINLW